jgi:subtilisin family serine protease
MKSVRGIGLGAALLLIVAGCQGVADAPEAARTPEVASTFSGVADATSAQGRYIVVGNRSALLRMERAGFTHAHTLANGTVFVVVGPGGDRGDPLEGLAGVQHVTPDVAIELDAFAVEGFTTFDGNGGGAPAEFWDLQWEKPLIGIPAAHDLATGAGTRIAIIDTGIQPGHPDLGNLNEALSVAFIGGERFDAGEPIDVSGHGTMVAGIAAAQGEGILGTAPAAELVSIRVFDHEGTMFLSDALLALEYAAEIGADVANLSLGTAPLPADAHAGGVRGAIERVVNGVVRQGTVVTAAGGNSATDLQHGGEWMIFTSMAGTIGASATGADDLLSFFSNYGTHAIHVAAPGGGMADPVDSYCGITEYILEGRIVEPGYETEVCFLHPDAAFPIPAHPDHPDATCFACTAPERPFPLNGILSTVYVPSLGVHGYGWEGGTSFAAPHVAGLVALIRELEPDMNPRRIAQAIARGAEGSPGRSDPEFGAGRIHALHTLQGLR